jgi:hypothetical protein
VSEYQYYDFRAIDRPLTKKEMAALRSISTRVAITTTSFTNHYKWGDLKGNPSKLLQIAASSKQTQLITGPPLTVGAPCFSRTVVEMSNSQLLPYRNSLRRPFIISSVVEKDFRYTRGIAAAPQVECEDTAAT